MKITSIKVMKRKNLGNYEHEEISMEAILTEGESAEKATLNLKTLVEDALNGTLGSHAPVAEEKSTVTVQLNKEGEPKATAEMQKGTSYPPAKEDKVRKPRTVKAAPVESTPAQEEEMEEVESPFVDNKTAEGQDVPPVIPAEAAPKTEETKKEPVQVSKERAPKPADASKPGKGIVAYDASIKEHRSRFATHLGNTYPKWTPDAKFGKTPEGGTDSPEKAKYKAAVQEFSKGLHGLPFEDAKGNMLDSFKEKLESFFGAK